MRSVYWAFISETKQRLQAENPTLSKTMVLEMARTEWKGHPARIEQMKNMSHSELSRRRLVPATRTRKSKPSSAEAPVQEKALEPEPPCEEASNEDEPDNEDDEDHDEGASDQDQVVDEID
ncbi:unnamed protein product [Durusdinium trenchii]|uniref:HMG box domain-containing protein n=1 Tax=Durusdinium trenchii TaxID=1381693 RepID=A0ABP0PRJ5_9DINO